MAPAVRPLLCLLLLVAASFAPRIAHAQIHRCVTGEGQEIYTDRRCVDVGATEQAPPPLQQPRALGATGVRVYRGCSHSLQDLVFEIQSAVDANDVNRLAGVYHWVGMSQGASVGVMDRLDAIVRRPLVDIVPVSGAPPDDGALPAATDQPAPPVVRHAPVGVRLEQTLGDSATPASTVFGLRRYLGCWWISL
ncbi:MULTISPECIES: hypothetical protein [Lysobacteraceae]|nr:MULTISPECIES: hypothetical protein [Lysobacter]